MRKILGTMAAALSLVGAIAVSSAPAAADWYYGHRHHGYYNYYGGHRGGSPCRPGWSVQGGVCKPYHCGVCKPYHYGPWDIYGGRQSDWGR